MLMLATPSLSVFDMLVSMGTLHRTYRSTSILFEQFWFGCDLEAFITVTLNVGVGGGCRVLDCYGARSGRGVCMMSNSMVSVHLLLSVLQPVNFRA